MKKIVTSIVAAVAAVSAAHALDVEFERAFAATDARCFVACGVPIAIVGTDGRSAHGADESDSLSSMDEMKAFLLAFLRREAK